MHYDHRVVTRAILSSRLWRKYCSERSRYTICHVTAPYSVTSSVLHKYVLHQIQYATRFAKATEVDIRVWVWQSSTSGLNSRQIYLIN